MTNLYNGDATLVWDSGQADVFVNLMTHVEDNLHDQTMYGWSGHAEPTKDNVTWGALGQLVEIRLADGTTSQAFAKEFLQDGTLTLIGIGKPSYA